VKRYDPDITPGPAAWLQLDEAERLEIVTAYHRRRHIQLPNAGLHAVIHVAVENQLAIGEGGVARVMTRLQAEGLSRHDAIHAVGSILAEHLYDLMREGSNMRKVYAGYLERLDKLTAASWRADSR
jgi:hypothetical protein